ncbi:hypothetical protein J1N35_032925 [Gossypium stocksii]|uniref:Uncharacterized protein n=2 Tax=Gossypium TaxID=3633 RepID=A0A9D3UPN2_9ROSI|nr:hypothetical protein J1N35_032925 [Gossypium stocksii]
MEFIKEGSKKRFWDQLTSTLTRRMWSYLEFKSRILSGAKVVHISQSMDQCIFGFLFILLGACTHQKGSGYIFFKIQKKIYLLRTSAIHIDPRCIFYLMLSQKVLGDILRGENTVSSMA